MQTDYESAAEAPPVNRRTIVGLLDLAAHVMGAPSAILCLDGAGSVSVVACTGIAEDRAEALGPDLAALRDRLDVSGLLIGPQPLSRGAAAGLQVLAGAAIAGPDLERLGSLWLCGPAARIDPDRRETESLRRIAGLIGTEIAEQVAMDGRLAAARAEAERATRSKSRFLSAANHDLRQPYQAIHLFLHLLQTKLSDPGQQSLVTRIQEAVQSSEILMTSLLELSTLDAGTVRPAVVRIGVGEILERMIREFEPAALAKGLRLRYVPCSAAVVTDPVLLERMLKHLIGNAVRFTAKGSIMIGCRRRGDRVRVEVWDTGPGIAEDKKAAVFEEFVQIAAAGPRDRGRGLGLGLAIVERTARLLGHGIDVCSTVGKGSVFTISMRRAGRAGEAAAADPVSVLVIGGDSVQVTALRVMLESWNCSVATAAVPEKAGAAADLLIAELRPGSAANGLEAVDSVRRRFGRAIPAIVVSGDDGPERVKLLGDADVSVLLRPFGPDHLKNVMEAALMRPIGPR
ncbi:hybrid sensor histidine kinase/response regulator [Skermanella pratensis]|uniref:hybrid sensor histidine kinase/response regulator n=1 Tax=Skermanella pratensis TaxID=2233999 RepID=UPI001301393C|nr:hybrid sensor histidine kinase/response regulator [Skermanella pratensis]